MNYTLTNDFHNTETTIRAGLAGKVSRRQIRRAWRKLCGVTGCVCGDAAGARGRQKWALIDHPDGSGQLILWDHQ